MAFESCVNTFNELVQSISKSSFYDCKMDEIVAEISKLNTTLMLYISQTDTEAREADTSNHEPQRAKKREMKYKCLKCNQTNRSMFNRKKTECTPCMSKVLYGKQKIKIEKGKERNVAARIARGECTVCKLKVTRENALSFDWDHRNPSEKTHQISKMNCKSDELFYSEIAKCDIVCRNCHIIKTQYQFDNNLIPKRKCKNVDNIIIE
jgi:DNA-directed RNA polymerase subunit RPC12/RpoP